MAFDAGFLAAIAAEIKQLALGGRVEKVYQPERDTVILQMRTFEGGGRLLINAGSSNPRVGFTQIPYENPQNPPQFCVLLRKHLSGAKLLSVTQIGFERVLVLEFETRDDMGYLCNRRLIIEVMGKYSNLIFTDGEDKVLAVLRPVDFTTSSKRQVLPGMRYDPRDPRGAAVEFCGGVSLSSAVGIGPRFLCFVLDFATKKSKTLCRFAGGGGLRFVAGGLRLPIASASAGDCGLESGERSFCKTVGGHPELLSF